MGVAGAAQRLSYCAREVRRHDYPRFLTTLFAPPQAREALFAVLAFNIEVAKTRAVVSEPMLGEIRLQWWREAVEEIFGGTVRQHEVVRPLADAVAAHKLDQSLLHTLIDARARDLDDTAFATWGEVDAYADGTVGALLSLCARICSPAETPAADFLRPLGRAWALAGLAMAYPFARAGGIVPFPQELAAEHGVTGAGLRQLEPGEPRLAAMTEAVCDRAAAALDEARGLDTQRGRRTRRDSRAVGLMAVVVRNRLSQLRHAGNDPFSLDPDRARRRLPLRLVWANMLGRY